MIRDRLAGPRRMSWASVRSSILPLLLVGIVAALQQTPDCHGQERSAPVRSADTLQTSAESTSEDVSDRVHQVGTASVDITPPLGYPMSGYFHERLASGTLDPLQAKAIVFQDGDNYAALVICDLLGIARELNEHVRQRAERLTGIPAEHILLAATHTHTGPDYYPELFRTQATDLNDPANDAYVARLVRGIVRAIETAQAACQPVSVQVGHGEQRGVSFNRRFVMADGTVRTWANYRDPSVIRAAGPIDPELGLLVFRVAETNELLAGFSTFALHLDTTGGTQWSGDFPAHVQRILHEQLGSKFLFVFGAGTCGNINHVDPHSTQRNQPEDIAAALSDTLLQSMAELTEVSPRLRVESRTIRGKLQPVDREQRERARQILAKVQSQNTVPFEDRVWAHKVMRLWAMHHGLEATATEKDTVSPTPAAATSATQQPLPRVDLPRKVSRPLLGVGDEVPLEVQAIQIGDETAIVGLPGEIFVELGLDIKLHSPFRNTLVVELANMDDIAYVPNRLAYEGGGYETTNCVLAAGTGEQLVDTAIGMLRDMKRATLEENTEAE